MFLRVFRRLALVWNADCAASSHDNRHTHNHHHVPDRKARYASRVGKKRRLLEAVIPLLFSGYVSDFRSSQKHDLERKPSSLNRQGFSDEGAT